MKRISYLEVERGMLIHLKDEWSSSTRKDRFDFICEVQDITTYGSRVSIKIGNFFEAFNSNTVLIVGELSIYSGDIIHVFEDMSEVDLFFLGK